MRIKISKRTIEWLIKIEGSTILLMLIPAILKEMNVDTRTTVHIVLISMFIWCYAMFFVCLDYFDTKE